jgi:hypothetical protein
MILIKIEILQLGADQVGVQVLGAGQATRQEHEVFKHFQGGITAALAARPHKPPGNEHTHYVEADLNTPRAPKPDA